MPSPSVTYTFANSTTADATQVNQNFTDIINGLTDGTKDLSISALTCAGTATLNGHVNLGNASADDLTITASLASTIPIKTTNSFDIGSSTLGLRKLYFGANSQTVALSGSGSMSATWTLTLPTTAGSSGQFLRTDGSGNTSWVAARSGPYDRVNYAISASVAASALTVALKAADGTDASATNPVNIVFRNSTVTTGTPVDRSVTGSLSIEVTSGATLGHRDGAVGYVYVYAIDNAGTVELAVSSFSGFDEGSVYTTTGMGSGADSSNVLYSTQSRSNVPIRFLGRIKSTQATAGAWATSPSELSLEVDHGALITSWELDSNFAASAGFGTVTAKAVYRRRVGDTMHVRGYWKNGTVAGSTGYIQIPSGYTIDTSKLPSTAVQRVGMANRIATGGAQPFGGGSASASGEVVLFFDGTTNNQIFIAVQGSSDVIEKFNVNGAGGFSNGDGFSFQFDVPISEWMI